MCSLPYVEATILELLRYKTIAPLAIAHSTLTDTEVGGYFIPAATTVSWLSCVIVPLGEFLRVVLLYMLV